MLHSFYNARGKGANCLDVLTERQVPTRCADNRMWAVANNSSAPYSHWASFVARPDATIAQQLPKDEPGMLVHDFPDGLSEGGWYHNEQPMRARGDERFTLSRVQDADWIEEDFARAIDHLRTRINPRRAEGIDGVLQFEVDGTTAALHIRNSIAEFVPTPGEHYRAPDARIRVSEVD